MARFNLEPDDLTPALVVALQHPLVLAALRSALGSQAAQPVEFATVRQYAERQHVCERTVQSWCKAGLPSHRAGRLVRIDVSRADAWLAAGGAAGRIKERAIRDAARTALHRVK